MKDRENESKGETIAVIEQNKQILAWHYYCRTSLPSFLVAEGEKEELTLPVGSFIPNCSSL